MMNKYCFDNLSAEFCLLIILTVVGVNKRGSNPVVVEVVVLVLVEVVVEVEVTVVVEVIVVVIEVVVNACGTNVERVVDDETDVVVDAAANVVMVVGVIVEGDGSEYGVD